jgi:hypothetical protein
MSDRFLECPACGLPCEAIPCCQDAHAECMADAGMWRHQLGPMWCEDRDGTCACGARLRVDVDDEYAYLVEAGDAT